VTNYKIPELEGTALLKENLFTDLGLKSFSRGQSIQSHSKSKHYRLMRKK
jgi:hypothetical protein